MSSSPRVPDPDPAPSVPAPRPRRPQRDGRRGRGRASSSSSPGPASAAAAPGRPGRGRTLTSVRARRRRRRRRALLGAGPGGRGAVPRAAARALLSGRRPPRRLLDHCRRLPRRAGGPDASPASAAPAPSSARGLAGSARYSGPPRMLLPPPLPLTRDRLSTAVRGRRAAHAGRLGAVLPLAACWWRRRPVRLRGGGGGAARSPGCGAPAPAASPPRGRGAFLGVVKVPASRRLYLCLSHPRRGAEPGRRSEGLRAALPVLSRAGAWVCDGLGREVRAGWSPPEPVHGQRGCRRK